MPARTVNVTPDTYQTTVQQWASRGLHITAQGNGWTTLERPTKPPRTFWQALKLSALTLGLYPLFVALWWILAAWWIKPIVAATRTTRVTIRVD